MPESPVGSDQPKSTSGRYTSDTSAAEQIEAAVAQLQSEISSRLQEGSRQLFESTARAIATAASRRAVADLLASVARIDQETSQASILRALLAGSSKFSDRALFLLVRPDETRGWAARGYSDSTAMEGIEIDRRGGYWDRLLGGAGTIVLDADECADLDRQLDVSSTKCGALIPFVLRGKLAAALYVSGETEPDHGSLRLLTHLAALTLETTVVGSASSSPSLQLAVPGAPTPGLEIWQAVGAAIATPDDREQADALVPGESGESAEIEDVAEEEEREGDNDRVLSAELPALESSALEPDLADIESATAAEEDFEAGEELEELDEELEELEEPSGEDEAPPLDVEEFESTEALDDGIRDEPAPVPIAHPPSFESAWKTDAEASTDSDADASTDSDTDSEVITAAFRTADDLAAPLEELPEIEGFGVAEELDEVEEDLVEEDLVEEDLVEEDLVEEEDEVDASIFDTTDDLESAVAGQEEQAARDDLDKGADLWSLEEDVEEPELEARDDLDDDEEDETYVGDAPEGELGVPVGQETVRLDVSHLQDQPPPAALTEEQRTTEGAAFEEPEFELEPEPLEDIRDAASVAAEEDDEYGDLSEAPTMVTSVAEHDLPSEAPTTITPVVDPDVPAKTPAPPVASSSPAPSSGLSSEVLPPEDLSGPGSAFVSTRSAEQTGHDQALHEEAKRLARLLVSEIKLYNEEIIEQGRREGNIYDRLKDDIDRSRQMYSERIDPRLVNAEDYFQQELVHRLANGDADLLGM